ncbi:MAG TPA: hypothetical protein DCO83_12730 [Mucilaginibacter sp.]|jgi:hypothetical protein|nr:hypothetical protein [Mucilaginibacter sp.]
MIKKIIFALILLSSFTRTFAQHERLDQITDSITNEGKALYRSEWASWYGTDIFVAKCPDKKPLSGGYFSYETNDGLTNIFFSKGDDPVVIASISFGKDFNANNYRLDTIQRKFTETEHDYYAIRMTALKRALSDTTFKHFNNTGINVVPLIEQEVKKVYVLTSPHANGVVIFGNDYLINFDSKNEITSIKTLHKNIIPIYTKADSGKTVAATMHSHLPETGDFITATDICTLMLYEKFTTWSTHYVLSKNYVSIWDCKKNDLIILTMEAWKRITDDQKTRHPNKE